MNTMKLNALVMATTMTAGFAFSAGSMAQAMSRDEYKIDKAGIATQTKSDREACTSLSGNASDICKAEAGGKDKVAKERCDTYASDAKTHCLDMAKARFGKS